MDSTLDQPAPIGDFEPSEATNLYRSVAKPRLSPTGGMLFRAATPATRPALERAIAPRCLRYPLDVRPKVGGYLPFLQDDEEGSELTPVPVLSNGTVSLLRHATIVRNVPDSALGRAKQQAVTAAQVKAGRALTEVEASAAQARAYSELLQTALIDEREAPVFYHHQTGHIFIAERSLQLAVDGAHALDTALQRHATRRVKFQGRCAEVMSEWLRSGQPPEGFDFGESALLVGAAKARAKFDNHDLQSEEVVEHLNAGLQVNELQLIHLDRVRFTLTTTGFVKGISLLQETPDDATTGMSGALLQMLHYASAVIPGIAAALAAVGGTFDAPEGTTPCA